MNFNVLRILWVAGIEHYPLHDGRKGLADHILQKSLHHHEAAAREAE